MWGFCFTDVYGLKLIYTDVVLLYEEESYKIRGCCFKVYNALGGGIREKVIERALCSELKQQGLKVAEQVRIDIVYGGEVVGTRFIHTPTIRTNQS